ncbi:MAG: geraniol dehydrogenase [Pseudonocardiales bacterium]|nr:geraniol dehydrogenase [Pseudonocardiales bacterium]
MSNGTSRVRFEAWVAPAPGERLVSEELELDEVRADEILVRVEAVGVCRTDVSFSNGSRPTPYPALLGHEGAGTVVEVGSAVEGVSIADRVVMSFSSCGLCRSCLAGRPAYCGSFRELNSGFPSSGPLARLHRRSGEPVAAGFFGQSSFATHALTHRANIVRTPDNVPAFLAAPFGCGVQTGAGAVLNAFALSAGDSIIVLGTGAVGMSAVMAAAAAGAGTIVAVDPVASRRALALTLGATHAVDAHERLDLTLTGIRPDGIDFVLDTTGRPEVIRAGVGALAKTGTLGLVAAGASGAEINLPLRDLIIGRRVRGIVEGDSVPQELIPRLLELWRRGHFPVERLIKTWPMADINDALDAIKDGTVIKPVLTL